MLRIFGAAAYDLCMEAGSALRQHRKIPVGADHPSPAVNSIHSGFVQQLQLRDAIQDAAKLSQRRSDAFVTQLALNQRNGLIVLHHHKVNFIFLFVAPVAQLIRAKTQIFQASTALRR